MGLTCKILVIPAWRNAFNTNIIDAVRRNKSHKRQPRHKTRVGSSQTQVSSPEVDGFPSDMKGTASRSPARSARHLTTVKKPLGVQTQKQARCNQPTRKHQQPQGKTQSLLRSH